MGSGTRRIPDAIRRIPTWRLTIEHKTEARFAGDTPGDNPRGVSSVPEHGPRAGPRRYGVILESGRAGHEKVHINTLTSPLLGPEEPRDNRQIRALTSHDLRKPLSGITSRGARWPTGIYTVFLTLPKLVQSVGESRCFSLTWRCGAAVHGPTCGG